MDLSICIPTCNEGELLVRTVESIQAVLSELDDDGERYEVLIADDGGDDDSVRQCVERWPGLVVVRHDQPSGTACAKALAGDGARGDVLIFLDGHTCPQPGAFITLLSVARIFGVACPTVSNLDPDTWECRSRGGAGMYVHPEQWNCHWLRLGQLPAGPVEPLRMTYSIPGQSFAIRRDVYDAVGGWDRGLIRWGSDASLALRLWCLGHDMYHHPDAVIGHLFRRRFPTNRPRPHWWHIYANRIRILRTIATPEEYERAAASMKSKAQAYQQAWQYVEERAVTIPRLQPRLVRSLTEYWQTIEGLGVASVEEGPAT